MDENSPSLEIINRTGDVLHAAFWWHQDYRDFFEERGVSSAVIDKGYEEGGKHKARVCRSILKQLSRHGDAGLGVAWKIIDATRALSGPVHPDNCDGQNFKTNWMRLDEALRSRTTRSQVDEAKRNKQALEEKARAERETELESVRLRVSELLSDASIDPVERGYELERLIGRLTIAHKIDYVPPKRQPGQQNDGVIKIDGRALVVEARWRKEKADNGDIQKLSSKARVRIPGALGLFISMQGFSAEGVTLWLQSGHQRDCILLQGSEIFKVFNRYITWPDALRQMIDQALVNGDVLVSLEV